MDYMLFAVTYKHDHGCLRRGETFTVHEQVVDGVVFSAVPWCAENLSQLTLVEVKRDGKVVRS